MNKNIDIFEQTTVTMAEIDRAIARAHQLRGEMMVEMIQKFSKWLGRSVSGILSWRPSFGNHALPLNR